MAEIGAIASILGVIGAGTKVSITLFQFGASIGSASTEIKAIGTEISLFCSVLKQLHSTLTKAKSFRYSLSAIATTQEILDQCQEIFFDIEAIVERLQKRKAGDVQPSLEFVQRVRWTFQKSKVQLLRTTLESCKITLHIMLTTLDFAQKIATRRHSTLETLQEDEQEQAVTESLIIAQQCAVEELERLEDEQEIAEADDHFSPTEEIIPDLEGAQSSRPVVRRPILPRLETSMNDGKRRSVWLNDMLFGNNVSQDVRRQSLASVLTTSTYQSQQSVYLLQKWTNQGDGLTNSSAEASSSQEELLGHTDPAPVQLLDDSESQIMEYSDGATVLKDKGETAPTPSTTKPANLTLVGWAPLYLDESLWSTFGGLRGTQVDFFGRATIHCPITVKASLVIMFALERAGLDKLPHIYDLVLSKNISKSAKSGKFVVSTSEAEDQILDADDIPAMMYQQRAGGNGPLPVYLLRKNLWLPPKESIKPLPWYPARRSPSGPSVPPKPLPPQLQVSADASLLTQDQGKEKFTLQDIGEPFEESALPSQSIPKARREAPLVSNSGLGRPLVKRGYLSKRGKNFGGWKSRYFILDRPALRYYTSYNGVLSPGGYLGSIQIRGAQIGRQQNPGPDEENPVYRHALLILEPNQKDPSTPIRHVLCAETDRKRDEWVEALLQYVNYEDE